LVDDVVKCKEKLVRF